MNILSASQMRQADTMTVSRQGITSLELMERASEAFVRVFTQEVSSGERIAVLCGPGNNGGDGLAIARLLHDAGYYNLEVLYIAFSGKQTADNKANFDRLPATLKVEELAVPGKEQKLHATVIIDALFGSGLNKPLQGDWKIFTDHINKLQRKVFAVDIPSGMPGDEPFSADTTAIKAHKVICFEQPKLNFFFPESARFMGDFEIVPIGLDPESISGAESPWKMTMEEDVRTLLRPRAAFSHKGTYGHALLVVGAERTMGAALLAASGCIHAGAGLTTVSMPASGLTALNVSLPEAMYLPQTENAIQSNGDKYTAAAVGPGTGTSAHAQHLLEEVLNLNPPVVIDADGLNILAKHKHLLHKLSPGTILTPHMKEFDRLFGEHQNWWDRLETARKQAAIFNCVIVLKNRFTFVVLPGGDVHINPTGTPAMASGGMGDILTGMLVGFLAQGYKPGDAACIAVYLHGRSGELLAETRSNVRASEVSAHVPVVIRGLLRGNG